MPPAGPLSGLAEADAHATELSSFILSVDDGRATVKSSAGNQAQWTDVEVGWRGDLPLWFDLNHLAQPVMTTTNGVWDLNLPRLRVTGSHEKPGVRIKLVDPGEVRLDLVGTRLKVALQFEVDDANWRGTVRADMGTLPFEGFQRNAGERGLKSIDDYDLFTRLHVGSTFIKTLGNKHLFGPSAMDGSPPWHIGEVEIARQGDAANGFHYFLKGPFQRALAAPIDSDYNDFIVVGQHDDD